MVLAATPLIQSQVFEDDHDGDGVVDVSRHRYTYDAQGTLLREVRTEDYRGDGSIDLVSGEANYSSTGWLVSRTSRTDVDRNGTADIVEQYSYNAQGWLLEQTRTADRDLDGSVDEVYELQNTYDGNGNVLLRVERQDTNSDGVVDYIFTQEATFGPSQNRVRFVESHDYDADGNADFVSFDESYSDAGVLLYAFQGRDDNRDGVPEHASSREDTYDEAGVLRKIVIRASADFNGDGSLDTEIQETTYDGTGRFVASSRSHDYHNDGTVDVVLDELLVNEAGEVWRQVSREDLNYDGNVDRFRLEETISDAAGRVQSYVSSEDVDLDGIVDNFYSLIHTTAPDGRQLTRVETRRDDAGNYIDTLIHTYDDANNIVSSVESRDYGGDGSVDLVLSETKYDARGRRTKQVTRQDYGHDGVVDELESWEQISDELGKLGTLSVSLRLRNGVLNKTETYRNAAGNTIRSITTYNENNDEYVESVTTTENKYTVSGSLLSTIVTVDRGGDGVLEQIETTLHTYDAGGVRRSTVRGVDYNGDGVVDFVFAEVSYDDAGREVLAISRSDSDQDGIPEGIRRTSHGYDADGRLQLLVDQQYLQEGGHPQSYVEEAYDPAERRLRHIRKYDNDTDGTADSVYSIILTYDDAGSTLTSTETDDRNGDGIPEFLHAFVYTYSSAGLRTRTETRDFDGDGTAEFIASLETTYDSAGSEASSVETWQVGDVVLVVLDSHYDSSGRLVRHITRGDGNLDAIADSSRGVKNTFDADGVLLQQVQLLGQDLNHDGLLDVTAVATQYSAGQVIRVIHSLDYGDDGTVEIVTREVLYDATGELLSEVVREDADRDGVVDGVTTYAHTYYADGRSRSYVVHRDTDGDGDVDFVSLDQLFDEAGRVLKNIERTDYNNDAVADALSSQVYTYDELGSVLTSTTATGYDVTGDGVMDTLTTHSVYDGSSRRSLISEWDYGSDGSVDFVTGEERYDVSGRPVWYALRSEWNYDGIADDVRETRFDGLGNKVSEWEARDQDRDGVVEFSDLVTSSYDELGRLVGTRRTLRTSELHQVLTYEFTYDSSGRMVHQVRSEDLDADGTVDRQLTTEFTYDTEGRVLSRVEKHDDDGDGNSNYIIAARWEYHANGALRTRTEHEDFNGDGRADLTGREEVYDSFGRTLYFALRRDHDRDGVLDGFFEERNTYDESGQLLDRSIRDDRNGDGVVDYTHFIQRRYTPGGGLAASSQREDFDGDGNYDSLSNTTVDYVVPGDAIGLAGKLIQKIQSLEVFEALSYLPVFVETARQNLQVGEASSDQQAVSDLEQFIQHVDQVGTNLRDTDRDDLVSTAEQIILFAGASLGTTPTDPRTLAGDVNLSGQVDFADFLILAANYGRRDDSLTWSDGDLDGDRLVAFTDFLILSANFGAGV